MKEAWDDLIAGGFDRLADAIEDEAVPAGADAVAVLVFGNGQSWVRLGGYWDADVVGAAVAGLIGAMAEDEAAALPVERFDA